MRDCSLNSKKNTSWKNVVYENCFFCFCFDIQNNICTQHVVNLYFSWNSMNNLSSYCGLTDARMRASEKDLPVTHFKNTGLKLLFSDLLTHNKLYLVGDSPFLWQPLLTFDCERGNTNDFYHFYLHIFYFFLDVHFCLNFPLNYL